MAETTRSRRSRSCSPRRRLSDVTTGWVYAEVRPEGPSPSAPALLTRGRGTGAGEGRGLPGEEARVVITVARAGPEALALALPARPARPPGGPAAGASRAVVD